MGGMFYKGDVNVQIQSVSPSVICNISSVPSNNVEILMIPSNAARKGIIIFNESVYRLFIKFGSGVNSESFTVLLSPQSTYEMSQTILYSGPIYGVWEDIDGQAHITELV